jgi:hypothetical protein
MSEPNKYPKYMICSPSSSAGTFAKFKEVERHEATLSWQNDNVIVIFRNFVIKKSSILESGYGVFATKFFEKGARVTTCCADTGSYCDFIQSLPTLYSNKGIGSFINVSAVHCNVHRSGKSYVKATVNICPGQELFYPALE